jgi:hypothetical protein
VHGEQIAQERSELPRPQVCLLAVELEAFAEPEVEAHGEPPEFCLV